MDGRTKRQLNARATRLKAEGKNPSQIADELKIDRSQWRFKSRGGGKVSLESVAQRKKAKSSYEKTRQSNIRMSTPKKADMTKATKKTMMIRNRGMEADHIAPVSRTGNALREMTGKRRGIYRARMNRAKVPLGDTAENLQALTPEANRTKEVQYQQLDRHLKRLSGRPMRAGMLGPAPGDVEVAPRSEQLGFKPIEMEVMLLNRLQIK